MDSQSNDQKLTETCLACQFYSNDKNFNFTLSNSLTKNHTCFAQYDYSKYKKIVESEPKLF